MNLYVRHIAIFVIYLVLQVFVFNNFTLFDLATPHLFLVFLLMMPISFRFPSVILIAFFAGLVLDLFSFDAFKGIHAFSCVLMMSLRNAWIKVFTSQVTYHGSEEYFLQSQPAAWYAQYLFPLILIHHLAYYFLEAFSFENAGLTLLKVGSSTLFTFALGFIFTLIFHKTSKR